MAPVLDIQGLRAGYGAANVLHGIDLTVDPGEIVVVLGANGAGKTTLMRAITGLIGHTGSIAVDGVAVGRIRPDIMLRHGIGLVPQGRGTLTNMTVRDNLLVGAVTRTAKAEVAADVERWCEVFPRLGRRMNQIARVMMSRPRLLLCDEVSLGLAPIVVQELFGILRDLNKDSGTGLLLVEQNAELALDIAARVYLLEVGSVAAAGPVEEFRANDAIRRAYLGY